MLLIQTKRRAWICGVAADMLLLAAGQLCYTVWVAGIHRYQVLMFLDEPAVMGGPQFRVFIDGKVAPFTFQMDVPSSSFKYLFGAGPVSSTKDRVTIDLVPYSNNPSHRAFRFEIESQTKDRVCDAIIEVRGAVPTLVGCSDRAYEI